MEKQALLNIDPVTVARYGLGGLLAGSGSAALINLIHNARALEKERSDLQNQEGTPDENTLVLTLPSHKKAEVSATAAEPHKIKVHEGSKVVTRFLQDHLTKQTRHYDGEFGTKQAAKGWPTLTAASLAALGSGTLGAALVDKLYQAKREKQLKEEVERAKQEYMGALSGQKQAEALEAIFPIFENEKQAAEGQSSFGVVSYPLAAAALLTMLGAGGTAYLTKKVLDAKVQEAEEQGRDIPKVKRIVFRTAPGGEPLPQADQTAVKAAFALMLDYVSGKSVCTADEGVKTAMAEAGITADDLMKKVADDADDAMSFLKQHPQLMDNLTGSLFQHNAMKRFALQTSPGRAYAVHHIGGLVRKLSPQTPPVVKAGQASGAGGGSGGVGGNASPSPKRITVKKRVRMTLPWMKSAQDIPGVGALATKAVGTLMSKEKTEPTAEDIAISMMDQQRQQKATAALAGMKMPDTVRLEGADPQAQKYLSEHQKQIVKLVRELAKEGQL